jgi:phosphoglycerate dehydrogenase-like enzyme
VIRIAVLDDYAGVALDVADWSPLCGRAEITVFRRNLHVPGEAAEVLSGFDVICCMRERMAVPAALIGRLPRLKLITITGPVHRTLDLQAATARGIPVCNALLHGAGRNATVELAWGLILSLARHLPDEVAAMRRGAWQSRVGTALAGRMLGLLGLGRLGRRMVPVAHAFRMEVIAWSTNLTPDAAAEAGARHVAKQDLFRLSDVLSLHLVLGERSCGIVGAAELALMKPTAWLVNTARGPLVDRAALLAVLREGRIAGAAIDVYDEEPLPPDDPLRALPNVVPTPHLGYAVRESMGEFYAQTVENIRAWLDGTPLRVINPAALPRSPA